MTVKIEIISHEIATTLPGDSLAQRVGTVRDHKFYPHAAMHVIGFEASTLRLIADYLDERDTR